MMSYILNIRNILFGSVLAVSFFANAQTALDLDALNTSLESLVQTHIDSFEIIQSGSILIDKTKTDINQGALSFGFNFDSVDLTLVSTSQPQKIALQGQFDLKTAQFGTEKKVDFDISVTLKSDLLAVLKHINTLFSDCTSVDPNDVFMVEICNFVALTEASTSATQLVPALEALRKALVSLLPPDGSTNDELGKLLSSLNVVQQIDSVMMSVVATQLELFGLDISGQVEMIFSDSGLEFKTSGATLLTEADYITFKSGLENTLVGLQNNDPNTVDSITGYTFFAFGLLEGIFL